MIARMKSTGARAGSGTGVSWSSGVMLRDILFARLPLPAATLPSATPGTGTAAAWPWQIRSDDELYRRFYESCHQATASAPDKPQADSQKTLIIPVQRPTGERRFNG